MENTCHRDRIQCAIIVMPIKGISIAINKQISPMTPAKWYPSHSDSTEADIWAWDLAKRMALNRENRLDNLIGLVISDKIY